MNNFFYNIVAHNPFVYSIWLHTIRNRKGTKVRLPSKEDDLYFDGYPKSGNTYFSGLISDVYPSLKFASHLHTIAGVKIALKKKLPVFIIIRHPGDAIISNISRKLISKPRDLSQNFVDNMVLIYSDYYEFVFHHRDSINIIHFNTAINDEQSVPNKVSNVLNLDTFTIDKFQIIRDRYKQRMQQKESWKHDMASSLPNKKREVFKDENRWKVKRSKFYERSVQIYEELVS